MKNSNIHINTRLRKTRTNKVVRKKKVSVYNQIKNTINVTLSLIKKHILLTIDLFRKIPKCVYGVILSILSLIWNNKKLTASILGLISAPLLSWYLKFNPLSLIPDIKPPIAHVDTNSESKSFNEVNRTNTINITNVVTVTNDINKNPPTTNVIIYVYQESLSSQSNKFKNRAGGYYINEERIGNDNPFIDNFKFLPK